jgi:arsenate reductase
MMTITIYHNPDSATSRNVLALIRNSGEEPEIIEYLKTPPSFDVLVDLLRRMDIPVRDVLRREGTPYDELGLDDAKWGADELTNLMQQNPILMNHPIVVSPLGVRLCRPSETVLNILPGAQEGAFRKEDGAPVIDDQGRRVDRTALD